MQDSCQRSVVSESMNLELSEGIFRDDILGNKIPQTGRYFEQQTFISRSSGGRKSEISPPAWLGSGDSPPRGLQQPISHCVPTWQRGEERRREGETEREGKEGAQGLPWVLGSLLYKDTNPTTTQAPHA